MNNISVALKKMSKSNLVLALQKGDRIYIGENIEIKILGRTHLNNGSRSAFQIAIEAPKEIKIKRESFNENITMKKCNVLQKPS